MRTKVLYALLFLAMAFAGGSLCWALLSGFFPSPLSTATATSDSTSGGRRTFLRSVFPDATQAEVTIMEAVLPETATDAGGLVRRVVEADEGNEEALRQTLLALGGEDLVWQAEGGYAVSLAPEAEARLLRTEGVRVRAAGLSVSQDLREAVAHLAPGERLRVTLICRNLPARTAVAREAAILGRVELIADTAVVAHLSGSALNTLLRRTGAGVLAADLKRDVELWQMADSGITTLRESLVESVFLGRDESVALMDTGISAGLEGLGTDDFHPDLEDGILAILPQPWWAFNRALKATDGGDLWGHGTHVAGIIAGTGKSSQGRRFRGVAPLSRLLVQNNAFGGKGGLAVPPDLRSVFAEAYAQGVRIHTDSWGSARPQDSAYDLGAWAADQFVWEHPDFLILFAAGNGGPEAETLAGGAALGKNVLTIGALNSEGTGAAEFSSRGPTADGRLKPELLAPGVEIVSSGPPPENGYRVASGTSMAAPYVAGVAAAWRQWLRETYDIPNPSAALMRALLMLGGLPVGTDEDPADALVPSAVLSPTDARLGFATFAYGATGSFSEMEVTQSEPGPFTAVMAWTDAPADIRARQTIVNQLSFSLINAQGRAVDAEIVRYGTAIRLTIPSLPVGTYTLRVTSERVPMPGGSGAVAFRLYTPNAIHFLHAPLQRVAPGTSEPLYFVVEGLEEAALVLETSEDGQHWKEASQNRRLDVTVDEGTQWYRWTWEGYQFGPYAVPVGEFVNLTVEDDGTGFVTSPQRGETTLCVGEEVTAIAHDGWQWEVSQAGTPTITRKIVSVAGWRLTETSSGKTLAQGEGTEAVFTMPKRPATLRWRKQDEIEYY